MSSTALSAENALRSTAMSMHLRHAMVQHLRLPTPGAHVGTAVLCAAVVVHQVHAAAAVYSTSKIQNSKNMNEKIENSKRFCGTAFNPPCFPGFI